MKRLHMGFLVSIIALVCISVGERASAVLAGDAVAPRTAVAAPLASGNIGGYVEQVNEVALAVESNGRIHALWTGVLNPYFKTFAFYSTSTDGVNWTPYQILNYWQAYEPQIVVDDVHHRVHLVYRSNYDGIVYHTVTNGVVSAPTVLDSDGVVSPHLAVDATTGFVYAVWRQGYMYLLDDGITSAWRQRTWYAYWNGSAWSGRLRKINDGDTCYSSIAAAPGGRVMLAWFQRCTQTAGGATDPGEPNVPRTAYGDSNPNKFPLRQAVSDFYSIPEKDDTILFTYSPGDDKFYLAAEHLMWPGHSIIYRYTWQNGTWSAPLDLVMNTDNWAAPVYVGAASNLAQVTYVYNYNDSLQMRTESNGVLGAPQALADYLTARGYAGTPQGFFTDRAGNLHMSVVGTKNGTVGFYYVRP
jgi:hypothetical protein